MHRHLLVNRKWLSIVVALFMVSWGAVPLGADSKPTTPAHWYAQAAPAKAPAPHHDDDEKPAAHRDEAEHKDEGKHENETKQQQEAAHKEDEHGEDDHDEDEEGGLGVLEHLHFPAPPPYLGIKPPDSLWTDPLVLAKGKKIYAQCAVCHGAKGDGEGPVAAALALPPADLTDSHEIAEMSADFWFWRASEGNQPTPYKMLSSAMPPFKKLLSVEDRWAVVAYQHTFSGHNGPHTRAEHGYPYDRAEDHGRMLWEMSCMWCHGSKGKGDGPAAFFIGAYSGPRPRNFTSGEFKFRSTASGDLPTDEDLFRTITRGIPGYMPSFAGLSKLERWMITLYIKRFIPGIGESKPEPMKLSRKQAPMTEESIKKGLLVFQQAERWTCHGFLGEGDGPSAPTLKDADGLLIKPANLTWPSTFKNGGAPRDIFRTLMTGLMGTPMPSYADAFEDREEDVWHLVNYVRWLSKE